MIEKEKLQLIPKVENYIQYELEMLLKLPRTEKYSIGTEYKESMYNTLEKVMFVNKINTIQKLTEKAENKRKTILGINKIQNTNNLNKNIIGIYNTDNLEIETLINLNRIDAMLNTQRIYLRIMYNNKWIDEKKFNVSMDKIYEIGKILGGLMKYYAK